eukprot:m.24313 g.24313  ORF g.24313 m.24313 type:complete len:189 (-) comp7451_c0_seq2:554-1120(-)
MADDVGCVPQHVVMRAKMACNLALDALEVWQATSAAGLSVANKLCNSELKQSHVMASDERERFELSLASQELLRRFQWDGVGDTEVLTRLCSSLTQSLAKLCAVHTTLDAMRQDLDVALWRLPVLSTCSLNRLGKACPMPHWSMFSKVIIVIACSSPPDTPEEVFSHFLYGVCRLFLVCVLQLMLLLE